MAIVLGHATRTHIANVLAKRVAGCKEFADELGRDIRHVEYHLRELEKIGWVEPVDEGGRDRDDHGRWARVRYRKTGRLWIDQATWEEVDPAGQAAMTAALMRDINDDIAEAAQAGTLDGPDNHISRTVLNLDDHGFTEIRQLLDDTLDRVIRIEEQCANRMKKGQASITTKVEMVHFRAPERSATQGS